jgi:hypothetical protein
LRFFARGIVAEPPSATRTSGAQREGDGADSPTRATKKASEWRLFLCAQRLAQSPQKKTFIKKKTTRIFKKQAFMYK